MQSQPLAWAGVESTFAGYGAYRYGNATNLSDSAAFAGAPDVQSEFKGIGLQRHTGWVGMGVSTTATARLDWNVNYDVQVGRGGINKQPNFRQAAVYVWLINKLEINDVSSYQHTKTYDKYE